MFFVEFCVHPTVPHSQSVAERLRCDFAQKNGTTSVSPPSCPLLLRDVYDAVLDVMGASEGASPSPAEIGGPKALHHTVYATALLLPVASNGTAFSSSQQGVPIMPPIVLPNSDTAARSCSSACEKR